MLSQYPRAFKNALMTVSYISIYTNFYSFDNINKKGFFKFVKNLYLLYVINYLPIGYYEAAVQCKNSINLEDMIIHSCTTMLSFWFQAIIVTLGSHKPFPLPKINL